MEDGLKQQLAIAVRSIQWSYGIFWSISASQPGMLVWGDGYYNGDIKTRKMVQTTEFNLDELGLMRSEQLRELYESLSSGESSGQVRRPSAALSPEDLTDAEWYYLVCMSFHFHIGQGLPGRTLATGHSIWLCDAPCADSKLFSRSLLAKSASIKVQKLLSEQTFGIPNTVACFPFHGGVIELGVTDTVPEDPELIQHVKGSLGTPRLSHSVKLLHDDFDTEMMAIGEDLETASPTSPYALDRINGIASQVQSWQLTDDDLSNCLPHSVNSSDCVSQAFIEPRNAIENQFQEDEEKGDNNDQSDVWNDEFHYQGILSSLLKTSEELIFVSNLQKGHRGSSFRVLKNVGSAYIGKPICVAASQRMLKSILFQVPQMHKDTFDGMQIDSSSMKNAVWRPEADETGLNHVLAERRQRERINERFSTLKSIVPSVNKADKVSILDDTIAYLKRLERMVVELERSTSGEAPRRNLPRDTSERTCDYCYGENMLGTGKRSSLSKKPSSVSKRKAREIDETVTEINYTDNLMVSIENKEVAIEMKCDWREGLLKEIINTASNLRLDSRTVQTSTTDGILSLVMRSKLVGTTPHPSAQTIRQTLQRFSRRLPQEQDYN